MIALAMLYAACVGAACAAAAWLAEQAATAAGRAARWGWALALAMTVALPGAALWQAMHDASARAVAGPAVATEQVDLARLLGARSPRTRGAGASEWRRVLVVLPRTVAAPAAWAALDRSLLAAWGVLTAALLVRTAAAAVRTRRVTRGWPTREVLGARVRVSPDVGPAAAGAWRAEVVLPAWALADERLPLILAHEREHVRAHDVRLLAVGALAAALVPWNPAAWWIVRRLRAAVEVDCDRRVLAGRGGTAVGAADALLRDYGALL